jgi:CRISPR-associated protein (TIGR02710 family)
MRKVLLLTVGTGTRPDVDIVKPLVKTLKDSNPDFAVFIVSEVSRQYAEKIAHELSIPPDQFEFVLLPDPDSLDSVYDHANSTLRSLISRGYCPEEISIDFTSGTKAMTSGVVLAGVAWGCASLKYISGKRKNGVVQDGTEKFITVQPNTIIAHRQIEIARNLIKEFRFESAISVFSSINKALLGDEEIKVLEGLKNIAHAYDNWDRFMQNRVDGYLSKVPGDIKECAFFMIAPSIRQRLIALYKALEKDEITDDLVADLFNNAKRRFDEGKYDDAISRLYRLVEMVAQMILWKDYRIKTGDVLENQIPPPYRESLRLKRDPFDGKIKIGLQKSYELLKAFGNPLGEKYFQNKRLSALLKQRNESFLAHGTKPISQDACKSLFDETRDLLKSSIQNFDNLCEELLFPWQKQTE